MLFENVIPLVDFPKNNGAFPKGWQQWWWFQCTHLLTLSFGAERLVVDAAVQLVSLGQNVPIFTAYHYRESCFEESLPGMLCILLLVCTLVLVLLFCVALRPIKKHLYYSMALSLQSFCL